MTFGFEQVSKVQKHINNSEHEKHQNGNNIDLFLITALMHFTVICIIKAIFTQQ